MNRHDDHSANPPNEKETTPANLDPEEIESRELEKLAGGISTPKTNLATTLLTNAC
jgi:hypothetical protein